MRQTPLTATESPGPSSPASSLRTRRRTPPPSRSSDSTVPVPATSPVNTSPLPEAGDDQDVVVDALGLDRHGRGAAAISSMPMPSTASWPSSRRASAAPRICAPRRSRPPRGRRPPGAARPRAAATGRRAGRARRVRPRHARPRSRRWRRSRQRPRSRAPDGGALGGARADDGQRHLGHAPDELRVERQACLGVEHDPPRLARDALDARGQARVVDERRSDTDAPRRPTPRASGAHARGWRRPRSTASRRCWLATLPSSVMADLNTTSGRPVRACLRKGWLSIRAAALISPSTKLTSTPSSRRMPGPRPAALGVGRRTRSRRVRSRPRRSRPCRAACGPGDSRARARRTSSRRTGPRRSRRSPSARRAPRRRLRDALADHAPGLDDHGPHDRVRARLPTRLGRPARWPEGGVARRAL